MDDKPLDLNPRRQPLIRWMTSGAALLAACSACLMIGCPSRADKVSSATENVGDEPRADHQSGTGDLIGPDAQPRANDPPGSGSPATESPATASPATESPATESPATESPATESPATESPATESPATESPATESPATESPATESPATGPAGADTEASKAVKASPLFEGWPKPQVAFFLTGRQQGYVEPCGCTGLENQKGGLARRFTLLQSIRKRGWEIAPFDVGSQVRRYGGQAELKFQMSVEALTKMSYRAVAFGADDLRLSVDALIAASVNDSPFMSANANILELSATHRVFEIGGRKIGVTAVLGAAAQGRVNNDEVEITSIAAGLPKALAEIKKHGCDYVVVLANATLDESRALVGKYADIDLIVTSGGAEEPAFTPETFENAKTLLVQVGAKGMYAGVLGLFADEKQPVRFQRVALNARYEDSQEMLRLMQVYQKKLQTLGLEKLGVRPLPHPSGRKFVGSTTCGECHTKAFEVWENTPHSNATLSIKEPYQRSEIARHFDPECLSCHVTGWNAQKFTPYESGYLDFAKSALLHGNGCENCHGPGSKHVAAESGDEMVGEEELSLRRLQMRISKAASEKKCLECHDLDNSPDFHAPGAFEEYYEKIEHSGRD